MIFIREHKKGYQNNNACVYLDVQAFCGAAGIQGVLGKSINAQRIIDIWKKYGKGEAIEVAGLITL